MAKETIEQVNHLLTQLAEVSDYTITELLDRFSAIYEFYDVLQITQHPEYDSIIKNNTSKLSSTFYEDASTIRKRISPSKKTPGI